MHVSKEGVQRLGGRFVEIAGRLVGEQQRRTHHERARHRDTLLFSTRQHAGPMREPIAEPDAAQQVFRARPRLVHRDPGDPHRHLGVLGGVELREQMMELEHEADLSVAERDDLLIGQRRDLGARDGDGSLVDAIQTAEHVQQRALSDARRTDDRDHLARVDLQIEIAQHDERTSGDVVAFDDAAGVD